MANPILDLLARNQGNVLTPELVVGLTQSIEGVLAEDTVHSSYSRVEPDPPEFVEQHPRLITSNRERVARWVADEVGQSCLWPGYSAVGWLDSEKFLITAGAVLESVTSTNANCHVAVRGGMSKTFAYAFFDYAFNQLSLERLTGYVNADNHAALEFDRKLGFEHEHTIKQGNGVDVHMLVMWRQSCKWINRE